MHGSGDSTLTDGGFCQRVAGKGERDLEKVVRQTHGLQVVDQEEEVVRGLLERDSNSTLMTLAKPSGSRWTSWPRSSRQLGRVGRLSRVDRLMDRSTAPSGRTRRRRDHGVGVGRCRRDTTNRSQRGLVRGRGAVREQRGAAAEADRGKEPFERVGPNRRFALR